MDLGKKPAESIVLVEAREWAEWPSVGASLACIVPLLACMAIKRFLLLVIGDLGHHLGNDDVGLGVVGCLVES